MRVRAALQVHAWLLGFHEEAHVAEVELQVERVVRPLLRACDADAALDLDFLLVGIVLALVVHVPTEGFPERVDEVLPRLGFLIAGLQVVVARMAFEAVDQLADAGVGRFESGGNGLAHCGRAPSSAS